MSESVPCIVCNETLTRNIVCIDCAVAGDAMGEYEDLQATAHEDADLDSDEDYDADDSYTASEADIDELITECAYTTRLTLRQNGFSFRNDSTFYAQFDAMIKNNIKQ